MTEREKVIKGLACCGIDECDSCPYFRSCDEDDLGTCRATLHRDALSLLKAQEPGWISVKDRMPEKSGRYLVYAKEGERETHRTIAPFQKAFHLSGRRAYWKVTHWMPLPEPPKEG